MTSRCSEDGVVRSGKNGGLVVAGGLDRILGARHCLVLDDILDGIHKSSCHVRTPLQCPRRLRQGFFITKRSAVGVALAHACSNRSSSIAVVFNRACGNLDRALFCKSSCRPQCHSNLFYRYLPALLILLLHTQVLLCFLGQCRTKPKKPSQNIPRGLAFCCTCRRVGCRQLPASQRSRSGTAG